MYQARKFVRRHTGLVAALAAVMAAMLLGLAGVSLALVQTRAAQRETRRAEITAQQINDFMNQMLASADPAVIRAYDVPLSALLEEAVKRLDAGALTEQPEAEATVRTTIGAAYRSLGLYPQSRAQFQSALGIRAAHFGEANLLVADSMLNLSSALTKDEEFEDAARLAEQAGEIRRALLGHDDARMLEAIQARAMIWARVGEPDKARGMLCEILPRAIRAAGENSELVAQIKGDLGFLSGCSNTTEEGLRLLEETRAAQLALYGADDDRIARTLINMGAHVVRLKQYNKAEALFTEALDMRRRLFGNDHPAVASALFHLTSAVHYTRGLAEEERLLREALAIRERRLAPAHAETAGSRGYVGVNLYRQGRHDDAELLLRTAIAELGEVLPHRSLLANRFRRHLAHCLRVQARFDEAETVLLDALRIAQASLAKTDEPRAVARDLAGLYQAWGNGEQAHVWRGRLETMTKTATTTQPAAD
jgi:serine/threonine-protein kinase